MNRAQRRAQLYVKPNEKSVRIAIDSTKPMDIADRIAVFAAAVQAIIGLRNNGCATHYELASLKGIVEVGRIVAKACHYNACDFNPLLSLMQSIEYTGSCTEEQIDAADRSLGKIQTMCARTPRRAWSLAIGEVERHLTLREAADRLAQMGEQHA